MSIPFDCVVAIATLEPGMVVELPVGFDESGRVMYERYDVVAPVVRALIRHRETGEERYVGADDGARLVETWRERPVNDLGVMCSRGRSTA